MESRGNVGRATRYISRMMGALAASVAMLFVQEQTVTTTRAEHLAAVYVKSHRKGRDYWSPAPKLRDVTTREIADRLHAQVFKYDGYTGSAREPESYLVKSGKIYPLSVGFGGYGLTAMCVADLKRDGAPELLYTYSWGSGLHRSLIDAIVFDGPNAKRISAAFFVQAVDLRFSKTAGGNVEVFATRLHASPSDGSKDVLLGRLTLKKHGGAGALGIVIAPHLSKEYRDLIIAIH